MSKKPTDRWQEVKNILYSALEMDAAGRSAFLDEMCGGDLELRREVESLIASHEKAGGRFESPAVEVMAETMVERNNDNLIGKAIGNYQVIEKRRSNCFRRLSFPTANQNSALRKRPRPPQS